MLPEPPLLLAFVVASLAVIISPGPDTFYVLSRSVGEGRLSGIVATLGISAGLMVHVSAAALGLSKLFAHAPLAYDALRWIGAAYLLYLAWCAFAASNTTLAPGANGERKRLSRAFGEAALTNLLNPKVAVFFIAFFPQFVDPARGDMAAQVLTLGALFGGGGVLWLVTLAYTFGYFGDWLRRSTRFWRWQRWFMGTSLGGLAIWLALPERR